ncbi:hypothetical protein GA0115258_1175171 [Streptomyces sp. LamerLS-31b]|nr:hypothetical protein GA0115258_1175171 [Streptomyces sp. LamerLS-31b]
MVRTYARPGPARRSGRLMVGGVGRSPSVSKTFAVRDGRWPSAGPTPGPTTAPRPRPPARSRGAGCRRGHGESDRSWRARARRGTANRASTCWPARPLARSQPIRRGPDSDRAATASRPAATPCASRSRPAWGRRTSARGRGTEGSSAARGPARPCPMPSSRTGGLLPRRPRAPRRGRRRRRTASARLRDVGGEVPREGGPSVRRGARPCHEELYHVADRSDVGVADDSGAADRAGADGGFLDGLEREGRRGRGVGGGGQESAAVHIGLPDRSERLARIEVLS